MTVFTPPPVVILGCGRSGTSIFGELFEHLPDYDYRSEPAFADVVSADYSSPLAVKVPRESEGFSPDPGLSFPLAVLRHKQPDMRLFWIVRHPLDAICSLRVGIAKNWGHHPKPPDWCDWLQRPLVERCAHHWACINSLGYAEVSQLASLVRFEDMISAPAEFARGICDRIGLDPRDRDQAVADWARRVQDTNNTDFVEAKTSRSYSRPDHTVRVGRWRENLSNEDIARVLPIVSATAQSFGYDLTGI
jgi:hypothetical protein